MAHIYQRGLSYWIKFRDPKTREEVRVSLETRDEAQARCRLRKIELLCALREPAVVLTELPDELEKFFDLESVSTAITPSIPPAPPSASPAPATPEIPLAPLSVESAVGAYYKLINAKNAANTVANKLSILRKAFGTDLVTRATGVTPKRAEHHEGSLKVQTVDELTVDLVQDFIEQKAEANKTRRHYRELFHHLFEECFKRHLLVPKSWHTPNPMSALPCYSTKNHVIEFLNDEQIAAQEQALKHDPVLEMAVTTLIEAGLRRSELLWLTRDSISANFEYLSVVNRLDDDDFESSLKTGSRPVTISPKLREALKPTCRPWKVGGYFPAHAASAGTKTTFQNAFAKPTRRRTSRPAPRCLPLGSLRSPGLSRRSPSAL